MSVNKVQLANGETIIDISDSTVTPETLSEGVTAHDASGRKITGKMIPGGGSSVQSDWNQTDETAADFIKNKPFGDSKTVIVPQGDVLFLFSEGDGGCGAVFENVEPVLDGDKIEVIWDGIAYSGTAISDPPLIIFGNIGLILGGDDTGEPYVGIYGGGIIALLDATATEDVTHNVAISRYSLKTIAERYLPEPKFYYSSADQYIYMDIGLTVKATVSDIPDNAVFSVGRVVSLGILTDAWFHPVMVSSGAAMLNSGYGVVRIMDGGEIIYLFTAEYTPKA